MTVLKEADERRLQTPSSEESGLGNSEEDTPSTDEIANVIVPPDGGWGWMVVLGSFVANLLVDGICYSSGLLLDPIAREFEVTLSRAALVSSLLTGCYLIAGPFVSALANRYGFRVVTIIGSVICGAAFGLSYFAPSIDVLCFSYGIMGGLGLSMIYMPSVIVVGFYFERWRALATGISLCGSGVGTFVFGPLTDTLIRNYGWRTTVAIQGGLISICVLCGLTFRPIRPVTLTLDEEDEEGLKKLEEAPKRLSINTAITAKEDSGLSLAFHISKHHRNAAHTWMGVANNTEYPTAAEIFRNSQCNLHRRLSANAAMIKGSQANGNATKLKYTVVPVTERDENSDETLAPNESTGNKDPLIRHLSFKLADPIEGKACRRNLPGNELVSRPMYKDDIFFGGSLKRLSMYQSTTSVGYHMAVTHMPTKEDIKEEHEFKFCPVAVKRTLATMLDVSLFKSPSFIVMAVSGFFMMLGLFVPFIYITNRAKQAGMDISVTRFLISAIGIANTVGRLVCGVVSSIQGVSTLWINNSAITLGAIATIISGLSYTPAYQFVYCSIFGVALACFASLRSILVVEFMGLDRLTNSFGLLLLFQGLGASISAPLAGMFYDATSNYDASFYSAGCFMLISALLCYPLNAINRWEKKKNGISEKEVNVV